MFQGSKKKKNLSTKSSRPNSKAPVKGQPKTNDLSSPLVSFFSLSSQTSGNLDDSLFSLNISNSNTASVNKKTDNEPDIFAFPDKKKISSTRNILTDNTINDSLKKQADTCQTNVNCSSVSNNFDFDSNKQVQTKFNHSTMIFKYETEDKVDEVENNIRLSIENNAMDEHYSDDDVLVSELKNNTNSLSPLSRRDSLQTSIRETVNHCPICLKTISNLKYVGHMKICAAKNKLSTQQLLSALELHKKQKAERKELGLDLPQQTFRAKTSPKRSKVNDKKIAGDSNLQLALALSASLRSAEEADLIQEAEVLKQAGLPDEADQRLSTLEQFGFASALPILPTTSAGSSKSRSTAPTLLLRRTKEERDRIVTEKVAIVLISEEENVSLDSLIEKELQLKSKHLKKEWNKEGRLWSMAHCPSEEGRVTFYVTTLSEFVSPTKAEVGQGLRHLSQLHGRLNTPVKEDISELQTSPRLFYDECEFAELPTPPNLTGIEGAKFKGVGEKPITPNRTNKLSLDWSMFVGNPVMSDVEVKCEDNVSVPAHKLVFQVRCPSVLNELVKDDMEKDQINWNYCSKSSVLAFLEYVYSASSNKIFNLSPKDFRSVSKLADRFEFSELKSLLRTLNLSTCSSKKHLGINIDAKKQLFIEADENKTDIQDNEEKQWFSRESDYILNHEENITQRSEGTQSPDMFNESSAVENDIEFQENNDDLDILASLVGKTTAQSVSFSSKYQTNELDKDSLVEFNESDSRKRKKSLTDFSDTEEVSLSKKLCSDSSQAASSLKCKDEVFDLTQSSNSSNEEILDGIKAKSREDVTSNKNNSNDSDEEICMSDLTQNNSCLVSPKGVTLNRSENCDFNNGSRSDDYAAPVWHGFDDDYLHFNYECQTPDKLSEKSFAEKSTIEKRSPEKCFQNLTPSSANSPQTIHCISSESKSPKLVKLISPSTTSPKIKSKFNYSISPDMYSHRTLDNFESSKHISDDKKHNSPDHKSYLELVRDNSSPDLNDSGKSKTRKNLNKQFDLTESSPENNHSSLKTKQTPTTKNNLPEITREKVEKRLSKKDSLEAMRRLLDDTFEISDSVFATADALIATETTINEKGSKPELKNATKPSTSCKDNDSINSCSKKVDSMMTPPSEIYVSDDVTPLPDYSAMKTPSLKKELSRFGLKPSLGRRKAKLLLRYIYDQTHPLVVEPAEREVGIFKQPLQSSVKSPCKKQSSVNLEDSASEEEEFCSQRSTSSSVSSSATIPEESFCEMEDILSQDLSNTGDIKASIRSIIFSNPELHRKVLLYDPIHFEELMAMLKTNGIKSKANLVMDFLDEQCITFRTSSWKATNEKRVLKQKSPKKKSKMANSDASQLSDKSNSPTKSTQTNVIKKRGRPRKTDKHS